MLHAVFCILSITKLLPPLSARSPDLTPNKNIYSWISETLARLHCQANTIGGVRYRTEATWNRLSVSVIQAQFDSMPNQIMAILASREVQLFLLISQLC